MNKSSETEPAEDHEILLHKIMKLILKNEQEELLQKIETLAPPPTDYTPLSKSQVVKYKPDNSDSSTDNNLINQDNIIPTSETLEDSNNPQKNKNKVEDKKENLESLSLKDYTEEIKDNTLLLDTKKLTKNEKKLKTNNKYNGKKRKEPDDTDDDINKNDSGVSLNRNKIISLENNIINKMTENQNEDKRKHIFEKKALLKLVKKEGFTKIFNCLSYMPLNRNDPLEKEIDDIITNIGLLRTTLILFQIKLELSNNYNSTPNLLDKYKLNKNKLLDYTSENEKEVEEVQLIVDGADDKVKSKEKIDKKVISNIKENKSIDLKYNQKNNLSKSKSLKKEISKEEMELGVHLQKDKDGNIYKYTKHHYRANGGNDIYVYYCADIKCKAKGCYYVKSMKFELFKEHELIYDDHCYIKNKDRLDKFSPIIEEFKKRNCREAQIFKRENGSQLVKWYD